jgi:uncharacterized membrane protein (UPF0127 family)
MVLCVFASLGERPYILGARIGQSHYQLRVADTKQAQSTGLGGRTSMSPNAGMLFSYTGSQKLCFWMKDMHFGLDMLWLDPHRKIVAIRQNVQPATYPRVYCTTGQYVIELKLGEVARSGLHVGQTVHF